MAKKVLNDHIGPVDRKIAGNLCGLMAAKMMTRKQLAAKLKMSEQGVDKYCNAHSRISASRLWAISKVLKVSILAFYAGIPGGWDTERMANARRV